MVFDELTAAPMRKAHEHAHQAAIATGTDTVQDYVGRAKVALELIHRGEARFRNKG
jgi:hypothetical protein